MGLAISGVGLDGSAGKEKRTAFYFTRKVGMIVDQMTRRRMFKAVMGGALAARGASARFDEGSREAFRRWFTWLAEAMYFARELPVEISDCASLIRFAYREALRAHTGEWARQWGFGWLPPLAEPAPGPPPLFLTASGEWRHFADARNLMRYNTRKVSDRTESAHPGDLLFYRQSGRDVWHVMAFLGRSQFESGNAGYAVYHTGPEGKWKGEVRRPTLAELRKHPEPRWRPVAGNANFLGVYRWNILMAGE